MKSGIEEKEGLVMLAQTYQAQVFAFSSMFVAVSIGLVVLPIFSLSLSLDEVNGMTLGLRLIFFGTTLFLADAGVYCITKTVSSNVIHREIMRQLKINKKGLLDYLIDVKMHIREEFPVLQQYRMADQTQKRVLDRLSKSQVWGSVAGSIIIPAVLFSFIWWNYVHFLDFLLVSQLIYLLSLWIVFRYMAIM